MSAAPVSARLLGGFDDPAITPERWAALLAEGDTDAVNLTWIWQRTWWQAFGRGRLLLVAAEREGTLEACAPLFADGGMVFNLCPEDSLDFVGDIADAAVLDAILRTARAHTEGFLGFRFYFVPDDARTGGRLQGAAARLGLTCMDEGALPSPWLDLAGQPEAAIACTRKKSLIRHERALLREAPLQIHHWRYSADILPQLEPFFEQHVARRAATPHPSLFLDPAQRAYYRRLTLEVGPAGWLRFTRLDWKERPLAFHFGLCYRGRYLFGIPSFAIELADRSPGEVLLRQLLLAALEEGAQRFDFGIGDEAYKYRFATHVTQLRTWGLYPLTGQAAPSAATGGSA